MSRLLASAAAVPLQLFFVCVWCAASVARPLLLLTVLCLASKPGAAWRKFQLFVTTIQYLLFCHDKQWTKDPIDPASPFLEDTTAPTAPENSTPNNTQNDTTGPTSTSFSPFIRRKTIIFIRHGESTWNDVFNKGSERSTLNFAISFFPNLIQAIYWELYFWLAGRASESVFFDAPLSELGVRQSRAIATGVLNRDAAYWTPKEAHLVQILKGNSGRGGATTNNATSAPTKHVSSQLISSNLRRAIATMAIGLEERLAPKDEYDNNTNIINNNTTFNNNNNDTILILPCLQEMSRNPDALCITPAYGTVVPAGTDPILPSIYGTTNPTNNSNPTKNKKTINGKIDTSLHSGNKPVHEKGRERLREFCRVAFDASVIPDDTHVVAAGHSLWFKSFFQTYLPYAAKSHIAQRQKLVNGGVVGFALLQKRVLLNTQPVQSEEDATEATTNPRRQPSVDDYSYHYMIDPASIVVLHGGF